jgi:hypothetical protein
MKEHRQIIKAIDIQIYFGKSQSMSNKMLRQMRTALSKMPYQPIIIKEFCNYYQVDEDSIVKVIRSNDDATIASSDHKPQGTVSENSATVAPIRPKKETEPYQFQSKDW